MAVVVTRPRDLSRGKLCSGRGEASEAGTRHLVRGSLADFSLPDAPELPSTRLAAGWRSAAMTAGVIVTVLVLAFV